MRLATSPRRSWSVIFVTSALLATLSLVTTSRSEALAQAPPSEDGIVVRRSYVQACERNLEALEAASRIVDRAEGARDECRADRARLERRLVAMELELKATKASAPSRLVWAGVGSAGTIALVLVLVLATR